MENSSDQINIKLVLLGDGEVGKTSLANYFLKGNIPKKYIPTIGSIILRKDYKLKNIQLRVNIWDIGGQRSFNPLNPSFYTNVDAAYLVFDLTKPKETLTDIKNVYLANLEKYAKECRTIIIGNKLDLLTNKNELNEIKSSLPDNISFLITSAKTGENVINTFELLIYIFLRYFETRFGNENYIGTAENFLNCIGKSENDLMNLLLNFNDISSLNLQKLPTEQKESDLKEQDLEKEDLSTVENKIAEAQKYIPIKQEIKKFDSAKDEIIQNFNNNLEKVEKLILNLKKVPIDLLIESIDKTKEQLDNIKENFHLNLNAIIEIIKKNKSRAK